MTFDFAEGLLAARTERLADGDGPLPLRIAGFIRHQIIHDIIKPGEPVRERIISEQLGVSRTPLRDALKILSVERLVELVPNRGAVAVNSSIDDLADMLSVYTELEAMGGAAACRRGNESDFLRVERQLALMKAASSEMDRVSYFRANQAFHLSIIAASRNRTLIELHANLSLRLYRVRYLSILAPEVWQSRSAEHEELIATLRARNPTRMAELQKAHFQMASRLIADWSHPER